MADGRWKIAPLEGALPAEHRDKPPEGLCRSETELKRACEVEDRAYTRDSVHALAPYKKKAGVEPQRWDGPFVPSGRSLHVRGESHHHLDGAWRRSNGG